MSENNEKSQSAFREEEVLKFWKENKIFEKSLKKNRKGSASSADKEYVFYEGPPTANGKPGIHHLEARAFKDVIPRYKTMQGFYVRRKGGWDTHGLPVELQVEKKLGLTSKKEIEKYGIAKFNQECKKSVWEHVDLWEKFTERIGFWLDQKNSYVTYHNNYIESVWNVIKTANDKNLLYKDYKVVPWCPRCGTGLSSHELAQGYENIKDLSVTVKFKIKGQENTYILAWTTTPWTLPGNVALAVGEKIDYVKVKIADEYLIIAKARVSILPEGYEIIEEFKGKDLIGLEYEAFYPYLQNTISDGEKIKIKKAYKIYNADFVTTEDGTGVVHTAVMYGQDDFALGTDVGLPKHHLVGLDGKFLEGTGFLEGRSVRPTRNAESVAFAGGDEDVAIDIIKDLANRGLLFKKEKYEHSYPHCWRCKTALIYYARDSWYIKMTKLRDKMVKENESINWEPSYIKEGRFGEWLREVKDWAISRERYWGSPLPVWTCNKCQKIKVIGSIEDIKNKTKKSGNKYFVMRHGQAKSNTKTDGGIVSCVVDNIDPLTKNGIEQIKKSSKELRDKKIDIIIYSDFLRTKQSDEIIKKEFNISDDNFISEARIRELNVGIFNGKTWNEYIEIRGDSNKYLYSVEGGESFKDVKLRTSEFIHDINNKYNNKKILIISHELPIRMLSAGVNYYNDEETLENLNNLYRSKNAEIKELNFTPLPHNENYELDLHRPYIDEVELVCDCRGKLERNREVMDCWFDSGAMPFAQDHYPFDPEGKNTSYGTGNKEQQILYPADFICEAIDQTRGWFYTLHAVGVIMGKGKAYKNVICLGHLLDANGKKMSKSLGNTVDPWEMMDKYGVDTLRLWMYSVNQSGESKNFDEKTVKELHNKVFNLLYNVIAFYELYRDKELEKNFSSSTIKIMNILDQWILIRLNELIENVTKHLDSYKLLEPVRAIRDFIDELSTWYVRRSRERLKNGDLEAKKTLYLVLKTLIKIMAPFAPFATEDIWQKLKNESDLESIHLVDWPVSKPGMDIMDMDKVIKEMQEVREVVTLGLQARQKAGIPVRQPLKELIITNCELSTEYVEIIKDEVNIKKVVFKKGKELKVEINIDVTLELRLEGQYRELVRAIQDLRKKKGLNPSDIIDLEIQTNTDGQEFINKFKLDLLKAVNVNQIKIAETDGTEIKIDEFIFIIELKNNRN